MDKCKCKATYNFTVIWREKGKEWLLPLLIVWYFCYIPKRWKNSMNKSEQQQQQQQQNI